VSRLTGIYYCDLHINGHQPIVSRQPPPSNQTIKARWQPKLWPPSTNAPAGYWRC